MTKSEKIAQVNAQLAADLAVEKMKKKRAEADYYAKVAELQSTAAELKNSISNEPDEQQEAQEEPVVWLSGRQHTAVITARRILRKMPPIPKDCSIDIALNHYADSGISLQIKAYNPKRNEKRFEEVWLNENDDADKQAADVSEWLERAERLLAYKPDNSHVAEPLGRALDAVFGGNPLDDFPTTGKEADNE